MSQGTIDLLKGINALPNPPPALDLYNRLMALGVDDDDFKEVMSEQDADFVRRLEALDVPKDKIQQIDTERSAIRAAITLQTGPAAASAASTASALDFTYKDQFNAPHVFDPSNALKGKAGYTKENLVYIRNEMVKQYPSFRGTHFDGVMQANPDKSKLVDALKAANAEIVQLKQAGPAAAPKPKGGTGVSMRKTRASSDWVPFGPTFQIDRNQLKHGMWSCTYRSTGHKPAWTNNATLSKELQGVLEAYLKGEPMDTMDLTEEEQTWLKHVWKYAKISAPKPAQKKLAVMKPKSGLQKKVSTIKLRLKTLIGEQDAGNDNPEVSKEMLQLARELLFLGEMAPADVAQVEALTK
jgi:hypothetical protein